MRLILIAGLCLAAAACSRSSEDRVRQDARDAGHDVDNAAHSVATDPTVRRAGDDLKQAGHDTAVAVRHGAAEAEVKTGQAMIDAGEKAKRDAEQARTDNRDQSRN